MNQEFNDPIISSRHHEGKQPQGNNPLVIIVVILILVFGAVVGFFYILESQPVVEDEFDMYDDVELEAKPADVQVILSKEKLGDKIKEIQEEVEKELAEEEAGTADFFYKRALQKEKEKDFNGAVEDYSKTIERAKKYSVEMWNSLNNRGIIKAQQLKDYRGAIKDFDKIISIETNRYDGEINSTRLEAGYTNRAYVKKLKGDIDGACDDLYEALSLGVEGSVDFIEKQIDRNCL